MSTRRRFSGEFKAKVALEALRGRPSVRPSLHHPLPTEATLTETDQPTWPPRTPSGAPSPSPAGPIQPQPKNVLNRTLAA